MAKGRDLGSVEARLVMLFGDQRFSPWNVVVMFRIILKGGGSGGEPSAA